MVAEVVAVALELNEEWDAPLITEPVAEVVVVVLVTTIFALFSLLPFAAVGAAPLPLLRMLLPSHVKEELRMSSCKCSLP